MEPWYPTDIDYTHAPECTLKNKDGSIEPFHGPACFYTLRSKYPFLDEITYHCHDLLSTKFGDTKYSDIFLNDFKTHCLYEKYRDYIEFKVNPNHRPEKFIRSVDLKVNLTKVNFNEFLYLASILRALQECPHNVTTYLELKEYLPEKSFFYIWCVSQFIQGVKYTSDTFKVINNISLYPLPERLDGHGILPMGYRHSFPTSLNIDAFLTAIEERTGYSSVWGSTKIALGWNMKKGSGGTCKPLILNKENLERILDGK